MTTSVQFIDGLDEEISEISLRKSKDSKTKIVVLIFDHLHAIERLRAYRKQITNLWLRDEEGEIKVTPSGVKFFFAEDEELFKVECSFEVDSEAVFERVMRFLHRYADENEFQFQATYKAPDSLTLNS